MFGWIDVGAAFRKKLPSALLAARGEAVATVQLVGGVRILACPQDDERDLVLRRDGALVVELEAPVPQPISKTLQPHLAGWPAAQQASVGALCDAAWAFADWEILQGVRVTAGLRADGALIDVRAEAQYHVCDPGC